MQVECVFFGPFRDAVGEKTVHREASGTVGDLLAELEGSHSGLDGRLLTDGDLSPDVAVTVNETHLQQLGDLATELEDGDVVRLMPPIHGG